ncbi:RMD1 family protein [Aestuariivivens sediminicola]|uniref:RMD1 family protein n=1 Tax=Aestuariivivens sediminicola TaxID=2913560 RepID=UPI001F580AD4|nr:RMD1 family protein [Aestuariivivens sediminicola]
MYPVVAYQLASAINLKACRQQLSWRLLFQDSDELYYTPSTNKYIYIFQYGMVSFFNMSESEIETVIEQIEPFCLLILNKSYQIMSKLTFNRIP